MYKLTQRMVRKHNFVNNILSMQIVYLKEHDMSTTEESMDTDAVKQEISLLSKDKTKLDGNISELRYG